MKMSESNEEELRNKFWDKLENELGAFIPLHIRNICRYNGLDNPLSIRFIEENTISDIEEFVRGTMSKLLANVVDKKIYFGVQHEHPENFKFNLGDKFLLINLAKHVSSKPLDHYGTKSLSINSSKQSIDEKYQLEFCASDEVRKLRKQISSTANKKAKHDKQEPRSERIFREMLKMEVLIEVTKKTKCRKDKKGDISEDVLEASIECPVCNTNLIATKRFDKDSRWSLSNYHRHVKAHAEKKANNDPTQESGDSIFVEELNPEEIAQDYFPDIDVNHEQQIGVSSGKIHSRMKRID